jgi:hypothetical protein
LDVILRSNCITILFRRVTKNVDELYDEQPMDSVGNLSTRTQYDDEIRLVSTVRHSHSIVAVSLADDRLFVLMRRGFNRLIVYDASASPPFELHRLRVDGHGDSVKGMAACSVNRCVYLSNDSKHAIVKVKLPDDSSCRQAWAMATSAAIKKRRRNRCCPVDRDGTWRRVPWDLRSLQKNSTCSSPARTTVACRSSPAPE